MKHVLNGNNFQFRSERLHSVTWKLGLIMLSQNMSSEKISEVSFEAENEIRISLNLLSKADLKSKLYG